AHPGLSPLPATRGPHVTGLPAGITISVSIGAITIGIGTKAVTQDAGDEPEGVEVAARPISPTLTMPPARTGLRAVEPWTAGGSEPGAAGESGSVAVGDHHSWCSDARCDARSESERCNKCDKSFAEHVNSPSIPVTTDSKRVDADLFLCFAGRWALHQFILASV